MKRLKMIICAMLSVCIVSVPAFGSVVSVSAEDVDSLRAQLIELKEKESEYKTILSQSENEIADQKEYNDALVEKIQVLSEKINLTRESINQLNESIAENQKKIDEGNASIEGQLDALCERLRAIYMAGSASDLEIILGAKDFSDLIDKMNLVKNLSKYDQDLIDAVNVKLAEIPAQANRRRPSLPPRPKKMIRSLRQNRPPPTLPIPLPQAAATYGLLSACTTSAPITAIQRAEVITTAA